MEKEYFLKASAMPFNTKKVKVKENKTTLSFRFSGAGCSKHPKPNKINANNMLVFQQTISLFLQYQHLKF